MTDRRHTIKRGSRWADTMRFTATVDGELDAEYDWSGYTVACQLRDTATGPVRHTFTLDPDLDTEAGAMIVDFELTGDETSALAVGLLTGFVIVSGPDFGPEIPVALRLRLVDDPNL